MLSDNAVLVTGFYEFTRSKEGKTLPSPARFTMLLIKHDGEWLIAHHHSSPAPNNKQEHHSYGSRDRLALRHWLTEKVMPERISAQCCIAGGGPAGMMLGYLLERRHTACARLVVGALRAHLVDACAHMAAVG